MKTIAVIPAGGAGKRLKSHVAKQYLLLDGVPVLAHTLRVFQNSKDIDEIILALPEEDIVHIRQELVEKYGLTKVTRTVSGGKERQDSVHNCLNAIEGICDVVVVHDAVRPFVTEELIARVVEAARAEGAAVAGVRIKDTIKNVRDDDTIATTVPRENLWAAQTPQAFQYELLKEAYRAADREKFYGTDDASLVERLGKEIKMVEGASENLKITTNEDMRIAGALMKNRIQGSMRSGFGYDSHRFAADRKLILGGVEIPFDKGLQGHSDADVLVHAICDALLGAAAAGDIGRHFPDSNSEYKNISSLILLERVKAIIEEKGFSIINIDATVVLETPKLAPHTDAMVSNIARVLKVSKDCVNIKAKTNEGMGFTGRNEGVAVFAVTALTERKNNNART